MRAGFTRRSFLAAGLISLGYRRAARAALDRSRLGIAVTPRNFPSHTPGDLDDAFRIAKQLADHAVFIFQWGELDLDTVRALLMKSRRVGLRPILGLSPTTLDRQRKELDIPAAIRRRAGGTASFSNPVIRRAYLDAAKDLARLEPPYLCLATEINFLAMQRLEEFLHFATLYKEAYREVKHLSPGTKVFVSFQWEWMRILDAREPHRIDEHGKVVDIFRPELDLIALTSYPAPFHGTPADLVPDYYAWVYRHARRDDEVMLMEVGWPTEAAGSEQEQTEFIARLPELLEGVNVSVVAWALLHDVGLAEFDADLNTVGLLTRDGRRKRGFEAFRP